MATSPPPLSSGNHFVMAGNPALDRADAKGNVKGDHRAVPMACGRMAVARSGFKPTSRNQHVGRGDYLTTPTMAAAADTRTGKFAAGLDLGHAASYYRHHRDTRQRAYSSASNIPAEPTSEQQSRRGHGRYRPGPTTPGP